MNKPAPQRREYLGTMKPNKTYAFRQAYFWVFTYPGSLASAVLEIREAKSAGAAYKTRRYAVTEAQPGPDGRRWFVYYKPFRERKPTDAAARYTVQFDHKNVGRCACTCPAFSNRGFCSHLESLFCLMGPRGPGNEVTGGKRADPPGRRAEHYEKTHPKTAARAKAAGNVITLCDWVTPPGKKSKQCRRCGRWAWDSDRVDRSGAAPCNATRVLQPAPGKPVVKRTLKPPPEPARKAPRAEPVGRGKSDPRQTRKDAPKTARKGGSAAPIHPGGKRAARGR